VDASARTEANAAAEAGAQAEAEAGAEAGAAAGAEGEAGAERDDVVFLTFAAPPKGGDWRAWQRAGLWLRACPCADGGCRFVGVCTRHVLDSDCRACSMNTLKEWFATLRAWAGDVITVSIDHVAKASHKERDAMSADVRALWNECGWATARVLVSGRAFLACEYDLGRLVCV